MMNFPDLDVWCRVSDGLLRRPGETIADAAARCVRRCRGRRLRAAELLLKQPCPDPWARLRAVDRVLRGVALQIVR